MAKLLSKKKVARTKEEQDRLKQEIIDAGRKLFTSRGSYGFSTRTLAKCVDMSQGNLYNYFKSKRELWIAIREQDFKKLIDEMEEIIHTFHGSISALVKKMTDYYLDFCSEQEYRFQMMYLIPAPPSKTIGPMEENYEIIDPLRIIRNFLKFAAENGEIKNQDMMILTFHIYSLIQGVAFVERDLRRTQKIYEPITQHSNEKIILQLRKELVKNIMNLL